MRTHRTAVASRNVISEILLLCNYFSCKAVPPKSSITFQLSSQQERSVQIREPMGDISYLNHSSVKIIAQTMSEILTLFVSESQTINLDLTHLRDLCGWCAGSSRSFPVPVWLSQLLSVLGWSHMV